MSNANQPYPQASVIEVTPGAAFAATGLPDIPVIAGCSSMGTYAPTLISSPAMLVSTFGTGDAVKKALYLLARVSTPIVFQRIATAVVAGVLGAVTVTRTASGTAPTNTLSGTPLDGADVVILYGTVGGVTGTGPIGYQISLNGGLTYGTVQALGTATSIVVLGVTLTLGTGKTITAGDTAAWLQTVASSTVLPVAFTGAGTAGAGSTVSGTPFDAYECAWRCVAGGTVGSSTNAPTYQYTLDYLAPSPVWSNVASLGTATSLALIDGPNTTTPSGLTLNFGAGTFVAGDIIAWNTSAPAYSSAGVTAAMTLLANWNGSWTWVYFCGPVTVSLASSVDSIVTNWDQGAKPSWGVVDSLDRATTETLAAWSARRDLEFTPYTSTHTGVSKGKARGTCPLTGRNNRRDAMMFLLARACGAGGATLVSDWGEYDFGPLSSDVTITDVNSNPVEYNSFTDQNGVTMGFLALRTWQGTAGIFPATASLLGPDGNIKLIPIRRAFNAAKILEKQIVLLDVCKSFRQWQAGATPTPYNVGDVYEPDARNMEHEGTEILLAGIFARGWCSSIAFTVARTPINLGGQNFQIAPAMQFSPLSYIKVAAATAQLVNAATPIG